MKPNELYALRTRGKKHISQQQLANLSGYTREYISYIETGKAKPSKRCWGALVSALSNATIWNLLGERKHQILLDDLLVGRGW